MSVAQSLIPDEAVEFSSKKHWIAPVRDSAVPILLMVGAYLIGRVSPDSESGVVGTIGNVLDLVRVGLMVIAIGWIGVNIIVWRTAEFVVTNLRVVREEGFVSRRSSATLLTSVSDVKSKVGFLGKALGYGDLAIFTQSGEAGADRFPRHHRTGGPSGRYPGPQDGSRRRLRRERFHRSCQVCDGRCSSRVDHLRRGFRPTRSGVWRMRSLAWPISRTAARSPMRSTTRRSSRSSRGCEPAACHEGAEGAWRRDPGCRHVKRPSRPPTVALARAIGPL